MDIGLQMSIMVQHGMAWHSASSSSAPLSLHPLLTLAPITLPLRPSYTPFSPCPSPSRPLPLLLLPVHTRLLLSTPSLLVVSVPFIPLQHPEPNGGQGPQGISGAQRHARDPLCPLSTTTLATIPY